MKSLVVSAVVCGLTLLVSPAMAQDLFWGNGSRLEAANADGTNVQTIALGNIKEIEVTDGVLYYRTGGSIWSVWRNLLDGSPSTEYFRATIGGQISSFAVDPLTGDVYWATLYDSNIYRNNAVLLDGLDGLHRSRHVQLD